MLQHSNLIHLSLCEFCKSEASINVHIFADNILPMFIILFDKSPTTLHKVAE